jgi:hypothetical protein
MPIYICATCENTQDECDCVPRKPPPKSDTAVYYEAQIQSLKARVAELEGAIDIVEDRGVLCDSGTCQLCDHIREARK